MGVFLNAIVCRKQDTVDVQALVSQLAAKEQDKEFKNFPEECAVTECQGGISIQLNDYCLEPDGVAKTLSQKLEGPVLAFGIYDDECWYYWLYREGRELDKFSTVPDCMVETDDIEEREQWRGNAALLAEEFGCLEEPLYEYLQFWGDGDWKDPWEVMDFLEALGFGFEEEDEDFLEEPDEEEWDSVPETIHYTGR
ncbi:MAG: hypothetical protein K2M91_09290, partial [Lachnospiraceae bacterium]|nr:hypothetical protein [Lachnospiraceae bacterium]